MSTNIQAIHIPIPEVVAKDANNLRCGLFSLNIQHHYNSTYSTDEEYTRGYKNGINVQGNLRSTTHSPKFRINLTQKETSVVKLISGGQPEKTDPDNKSGQETCRFDCLEYNLIGRQNPQRDGFLDSLESTVDPKLLVDPDGVRLDCPRSDHQLGSDLLIGQLLPQEFQYLQFPVSQHSKKIFLIHGGYRLLRSWE